MGGNALQAQSVRLPAARYHGVERALVQLLRQRFPARRIEAIIAYADKPDFGDLDILVEDGAAYDPALLAAALGATEIVANGDVTSVGVQLEEGIFQVDLIKTAAASFDFAARYFGYNDFGNLVGRVAHKFGAKFGHLGLLYQLRDPDTSSHQIAQLSITADFDTALTLLGYDAARYEAMRSARQFRTLDDIFRFVIASPYVNRDIYLLDKRSHKARIRDAKRATYKAFLLWLDEQPPASLPAHCWGEDGTPQRQEQQAGFLQAAFAQVPAFQHSYHAALAAAARAGQLKLKFNAALVAGITGFSGRKLGAVMLQVRNSFADENAFENFFLEGSDDAITARIANEASRADLRLANRFS